MRIFIAALLIVMTFGSVGVVPTAFAQSSDEKVRINEIVISGNRRVAVGTVLSYLPLQVGDLAGSSALNIALDRLYETDLFRDIDMAIDGQVLRITVAENPIINRVNIEGNDAISDEKLMEFLDI